MGRLDARHWARKRTSCVPSLLGAEAHLPEQLVCAPAAGEVGRGQRECGTGWEGVWGNVRAGQGEEGLLRGCGPEYPGLVHVRGGQGRPPPRLQRVEKALHEEESFVLLTLGRHHRFGADKLDHPLRNPPQVEVETYSGVPRNSPTRQPLRRMEQRRKPGVNQQAVDA